MSNGDSAPAPEVQPPASDAGSRDRLFRIIALAAVGGSAALICWSFFSVLAPRIQQSRELSSTVSRLSAEVEDLERQWPADVATQVSNKFSRVDALLFPGRPDLQAWLDSLKDQATLLTLNIRSELAPASPQTAGGRTFGVIPATISIDFPPAAPATSAAFPAQRILRLVQRLTGGEKRADLTELTVAGGTNSISHAVLGLSYWTDKEGTP